MPSSALSHTISPIRFLREPELLARTGLSPTMIDILEAKGQFPRRVPIGTKAVAWIESEVAEWQLQRIAIRDDAVTEAQARRKRRVERRHEPGVAGPV
jgi:prophage regulatory protein